MVSFNIYLPPLPAQINQEDKILQLLKSWTQLFAVLMVTSPVEGTTALPLLCDVVRARVGTPCPAPGPPPFWYGQALLGPGT